METCIHQIFPLDMQGPAEYCQEDSVDGYYCAEHDPQNAEPDWDDVRKDQLVGKFDCE
jgi:hypothetical protein